MDNMMRKIDAMRESQWVALETTLKPDPQDLFSATDSRETSAPAPQTRVAMDSRETQRADFGSDSWSGRL